MYEKEYTKRKTTRYNILSKLCSCGADRTRWKERTRYEKPSLVPTSNSKVDEEVTLVIHNKKPKRTEQQNRYYWGVYLPLIAEETGEHDLDRLHELFKGKFLTQGVVEVLGEKVRMKKSTTELAIQEFSAYIMDIEALTGVKAPPTESYGLESLRGPETQIDYPESEGEPLF